MLLMVPLLPVLLLLLLACMARSALVWCICVCLCLCCSLVVTAAGLLGVSVQDALEAYGLYFVQHVEDQVGRKWVEADDASNFQSSEYHS